MAQASDVSVSSIRSYFQSLSPVSRANISEVGTLLTLILVVPATDAISERSASALQRVKTYLRSTMSQARLNYLLILHCHNKRTVDLSLESCLSEFVECREWTAVIFGKFWWAVLSGSAEIHEFKPHHNVINICNNTLSNYVLSMHVWSACFGILYLVYTCIQTMQR